MHRAFASLLLVLFAHPVAALTLPGGWDFGTASDQKPLAHAVTVLNDARAAVTVRLVSSCDCLTLTPSTFALGAGKSITVTVRFDPAGYSGKIDKPVLVDTGDGIKTLYTVTGTITPARGATAGASSGCAGCDDVAEALRQQAYESWRKQPSVVHYYYSRDCKSCIEFLDTEVPRIEKRVGKKIEIDRQDIDAPGVLDELDRVLAANKRALAVLPVLVAGSTVFQGEKEIRAGFEAEMSRRAKGAGP